MPPPELYIEAEDHAYIKASVKKASFREVGFLGVVEITGSESDAFGLVRHLRILKQETSSGEVEFDDEAFADYLEWLYTPVDDGGAGFEGTQYGLFSAHSHGNMGVFWSSTDEDAIKKYGISAAWVFSSVFNGRSESKHRLDVFKGLDAACPIVENAQVTFNDAKLLVLMHPAAQPIVDEINKTKADYDSRVKEVSAPVAEAEAALAEAKKNVKDAVAAIEKESKESVKALEDGLKDATEGALKDIVKRVDADFKEYVSHSQNWTNSRSSGTGSGGSGSNGSSPGKASGNRSQKALSQSSSGHSSGSSGKGGNGAGASGGGKNPYDRNLDKIVDPYRLVYRVFDTDLNSVYGTTLETILGDKQLILLEPVEDVILNRLKAEEIQHLIDADRGNYLNVEHAASLLDKNTKTTKEKLDEKKSKHSDGEGDHVHAGSGSKGKSKATAKK